MKRREFITLCAPNDDFLGIWGFSRHVLTPTLKKFATRLPRILLLFYRKAPPKGACTLAQYGQRRSRRFHLPGVPGTL